MKKHVRGSDCGRLDVANCPGPHREGFKQWLSRKGWELLQWITGGRL